METDWDLIREMMKAAIDTCERIEKAGYKESDREATIDVNGQQVSVHDILVSAWTMPENIRYQIIRERHLSGSDLHYVPEAARILTATAQAGAELIGASTPGPAEDDIRRMITWFKDHAAPGIETAIKTRRNAA